MVYGAIPASRTRATAPIPEMVHMSVRSRYRLMLVLIATIFVCSILPGIFRAATALVRWANNRDDPLRGGPVRWKPGQAPVAMEEWDSSDWENPLVTPRPKTYKPAPTPALPVADPFPLLSQNPPPQQSLLQAPEINRPPKRHYPEQTPLFVGFTRNWPQLLQCVVSYIAAGWPPEDIHVVENTGVMSANKEGKLTLQNPFYLNHTQLAMLGVNVIMTPTLLTFSQLQNFYLWTALANSYPYFFWTHQDLLVFSHENSTTRTPRSLYTNAVLTLRHLTSPPSTPRRHPNLYPDLPSPHTWNWNWNALKPRPNPAAVSPHSDKSTTQTQPQTKEENKKTKPWAHHFFAYDHLTLVHRDAVLAAGAWDTHLPFYASDCDMYLRLQWAGYSQGRSVDDEAGLILDVGSVLGDLGALLRVAGVRGTLPLVSASARGGGEGKRGRGRGREMGMGGKKEGVVKGYVESWERLVALGEEMVRDKYAEGNAWRNRWQVKQRGGEGEPFYRDAEGFETGVRMLIDTGRSVFAEKWGHRGCDLDRMGVRGEDAWRLERDWDEETEGMGYEGGSW